MDYFGFKHFTIRHDRCAMKVGTDGVLLGAWADVAHARRILDVGCGSGLVSIMAAQRSEGDVVGVEIDDEAAGQAAENAAASPFSGRIEIVSEDIRIFQRQVLFDCVVSNPPFFVESTASPDFRRAVARHTNSLSYEVLIENVLRLMAPDASFQLIIPFANARAFKAMCTLRGLSLVRQTDVATKAGVIPKRTLLHFVKNITATVPVFDTLTLFDENGKKTERYEMLTGDFYLDKA